MTALVSTSKTALVRVVFAGLANPSDAVCS